MSHSAPTTPLVRIGTIPELIQMVPYLLGFTPQESLVVIALNDNQIAVTARIDLAEAMAYTPEGLFAQILHQFPRAEFVALAFTDDRSTAEKVLVRCSEFTMVATPLTVVGDYWYGLDGTEGAVEPVARIDAVAASAGMEVKASRDELAKGFASADPATPGLPTEEQLRLGIEKTQTLPEHAALNDAVELIGGNLGNKSLSTQVAARLFLLAHRNDVCDLAMLMLYRHNAEAHLTLWQQVVNLSPRHHSDRALVLAGLAAWVSSDGALANIARELVVDLGQELPREHPIALLDTLIAEVIPPTRWEEIRGELAREANPAIVEVLAQNAAPGTLS